MSRSAVTSGQMRSARRARRSLGLKPMLLVSLGVLAVGWSALWLVARHETSKAVRAWIAEERARGRAWTCPSEQIGGFPLSIALSCNHPTFRGAAADGVFQGEIAGFRAEAPLYFPASVAVAVTGPLTLDEIGGAHRSVRATWSRGELGLRGEVPGDLDRGQFEATDLDATVQAGGMAEVRMTHARIAMRALAPGGPLPADLELAVNVDGLDNADMNAFFGSEQPASIALKAVATRVAIAGPTFPLLLEPWREAGGQLQLKTATLTKGAFQASGGGRIGLDDDHRVAGRLDAQFAGLEPIAERWGIPLGAVKIGGALSQLLGGKRAAPEPSPSAAELSLPLIAKDGRLWIGPVKTAVVLPPLY